MVMAFCARVNQIVIHTEDRYSGLASNAPKLSNQTNWTLVPNGSVMTKDCDSARIAGMKKNSSRTRSCGSSRSSGSHASR
jgi:hypothetical protein